MRGGEVGRTRSANRPAPHPNPLPASGERGRVGLEAKKSRIRRAARVRRVRAYGPGTACLGGPRAAGRARLLDRRAHCVAAVERERPRARAALLRQCRQFAAERVARRHVEGGEPAAQAGAQRRAAGRPGRRNRRSAGAASATTSTRPRQRFAPRRDHRQGVGDEHPVEGGDGRTAPADRNRVASPWASAMRPRARRGDRGARGRQHFAPTRRGRRTAALGIAARGADEVAPGAAADFQHASRPAAARGRRSARRGRADRTCACDRRCGAGAGTSGPSAAAASLTLRARRDGSAP